MPPWSILLLRLSTELLGWFVNLCFFFFSFPTFKMVFLPYFLVQFFFYILCCVVCGVGSRGSVERRHRGTLGWIFSLSGCRGSISCGLTHCLLAKGFFYCYPVHTFIKLIFIYQNLLSKFPKGTMPNTNSQLRDSLVCWVLPLPSFAWALHHKETLRHSLHVSDRK